MAFPHHENELAQSACAHPDERFAKIWMHNEMLIIDGEKMSKSLGNFYTVRDLLDGRARLAGGKLSGQEIRIALLLSHYRDPMDFGVARRHEARALAKELAQKLGGNGTVALTNLKPKDPLPEVVEALADDLDTNKALRLLRRRPLNDRYGPDGVVERLSNIYASQLMLGIDFKSSAIAQDAARENDELRGVIASAIGVIELLREFESRIDAARAARDYSLADEIREALLGVGVEVKTTKEGTRLSRLPNFDREKLKDLT